ncbi:MAG TPA: flagellin [Acidobacteriota bacterium]|nr:flagellin [Acidobacteriota bacterium]
MSLRINHNLAALNANRNLKLTNDALTKSMQKLSSGFRINAAADDPAGLVISEQFRSQIAGLNRAIQNSEGSISMIQTAEGALTEINNLLISMRELAIHAANEGFNDTDQLAADQAEIANAIKTIDRIAANTQFGTKKILDGSKDNIATITSANSSGLSIIKSGLSTGLHSISATKTADSTASLNTTSLGLSLANTDGDPANLVEKIHNLDVLQASDVAKKSTGTITLADAWGNDLTLAAAATSGMVSSAAALAVATAGNVGTYDIILNYQEYGESPAGNQVVSIDVALNDTAADVAGKIESQINLNTELAGRLVVTATAAGSPIRIKTANTGAQYTVRVESVTANPADAGSQLFDFTAASSRGQSANVLEFTVVTEQWASGRTAQATVGAAGYNSLDTLITAMNTALATTGGSGGFGTIIGGVNDIVATEANTNQIQFSTQDEGSAYSIKLSEHAGTAGVGNLINVLGLTTDTLPNTGIDALVRFDDYTNTITAAKYGTTHDVTLYNKDADDSSRGTATFTVATALNGINVGNLLLDVKAAKFGVRLDGGPASSVTAGINSTIFNANRSESIVVRYGLDSNGGTETINNFNQSLVFQIGGNVGQTTEIGIRNMAASSLAKNLAGNMFTSLAEMDVTTVQGAQDAQALIDNAILEVSTARGTLGSFQKNTLESNLRNLRVAAQNLTASESQIRDTDMAEEMSEFTKNQILVQTGMAMLAQSNQIPQVVLSLF